jgi:FkbM family methyltransferase
MHRFSINYAPLMTTFLLRQTKVFRDDPIVILDVGARGGVGPEWEALGDQARIYAFEPAEEECKRLAASAPPHLTYIPRALGMSRGTQTLYETAQSASSGLYKTQMDYFNRLLNRENGVTVSETTVEVRSLDEVLTEYNVPSVDFIKIDIEGAELDVLRGATGCLSGRSPLGLLSEIRFHEEINGSPPFSVLDVFLREHGLRLFDLQFHYQSRIAMPYPGPERRYRSPAPKYFGYTTHGQLQDGDALYFRDLLLPAGNPMLQHMSAAAILKMCVFMEIFSKSDCAAELLLASRDRIDAIVDSTRLLDLLATGINGTATTFREYTDWYFNGPTPTAAGVTIARGRALLGRGRRKLRKWLGNR